MPQHAIRSHLAVVHPSLAARDDVVLLLPRRPGESTWRPSDVLNFIQEEGDKTALVFLSGVHYSTGQLFDMAGITRTAHEQYGKEIPIFVRRAPISPVYSAPIFTHHLGAA